MARGAGAMSGGMKIWQMNDCDWWLANTAREATASLLETYGMTLDDVSEDTPRELSDADLARLTFWDDENRDPQDFSHWKCECGAVADANCRWNGSAYEHHHGYPVGHVLMKNIHARSFGEELARQLTSGDTRPRLFASTEY